MQKNRPALDLRITVIFIILPLLFLISPPSVRSESTAEKGLAIAKEADRRDSGYEDFTADMLMTLRNRHGQESTRELRYRTLEVDNDGDMNLTIFDSPKDVKGTALLNYTHKAGDDDQWLYLPALKRVKRISSSNKSGSFMGSEFSYEDIASQEIEKYTYDWLRDEMYDNRECFVLERRPVDTRNSGYSRQVVWIDKAEYRIWKVDYYDRKNELLKTLTFSGYHQYENSFWRPDRMFMVNHQTGKSTELSFSDYRFKTGLTPDDFNKNSLKRVK